MTEMEKAYLGHYEGILRDTEGKMKGLLGAVTKRWKPAADLSQVDETSPVIGDEEYSEFCDLAEIMAQTYTIRATALFFGLPEHVIDSIVLERLRNVLAPPSKKGSGHHVVRQAKEK